VGRLFGVVGSYTEAFELFVMINLIGAAAAFARCSYAQNALAGSPLRPRLTYHAASQPFGSFGFSGKRGQKSGSNT
jgi:hypothetical protein